MTNISRTLNLKVFFHFPYAFGELGMSFIQSIKEKSNQTEITANNSIDTPVLRNTINRRRE